MSVTNCSICGKPAMNDDGPIGDIVDCYKYDFDGSLDYIMLMHRKCAVGKGYKIKNDRVVEMLLEPNESFDKNYPNRKDWRKPYVKVGKHDASCRPGGGCSYCKDNRQFGDKKREQSAASRTENSDAAVAISKNESTSAKRFGNVVLEMRLVEDDDTRAELKRVEYKGKPAWQFREFMMQGTTKEHNRMIGYAEYMPADELYDKLKRGVFAPGGRRCRIWKLSNLREAHGPIEWNYLMSKAQKEWGIDIQQVDLEALKFELKTAKRFSEKDILLPMKPAFKGNLPRISIEDAENIIKNHQGFIRGMKAYTQSRW